MGLIWCIRHGEERGFHNDLEACVACHCRKRKRCQPYSLVPLDTLLIAKSRAKQNGHSVQVELPLFESSCCGD